MMSSHPKNSFTVFLLVSLTLLITTPISFAEIYKWTDAQGKTRFSDHPPEEQITAEEVSSQLSPLNRDSSSEETQKLQQVFKGPTPEEKALQQQEKRKQQQRTKQACNKAKQRLAVIKGPVYFTDEDGKEVVVTEIERQQRVARLEQEIRENCP